MAKVWKEKWNDKSESGLDVLELSYSLGLFPLHIAKQ